MISAHTLRFLSLLKDNNNKPWFEANKKQYVQGQQELVGIVQEWITGFSPFEPAIAHLEPKKCVFRIYRDVRFSTDKTPYKTNMGAYLSPGGKNTYLAGYYLHVEPEKSFFGTGMYQPEGTVLAKIRQEIDYNLDEFTAILEDKEFKKYFPQLEKEDTLKNPPKGYDKDHPAIEWLKLKSFVVFTPIGDDILMSKDLPAFLTTLSKTATPFTAFLNRSLE